MLVRIYEIHSENDIYEFAKLKLQRDNEALEEYDQESFLGHALETTLDLFFNPSAQCLIAKINEEPVGFAIGYVTDKFFLGSDVYVLPFYRGKGVGKQIIGEHIKMARELGLQNRSVISRENFFSIQM